jgi:hypothetical protein
MMPALVFTGVGMSGLSTGLPEGRIVAMRDLREIVLQVTKVTSRDHHVSCFVHYATRGVGWSVGEFSDDMV